MKRQLNFSANNYGPLQQNAAHNFAGAYALNIYQSQAIYSFIPKNACSTMRTSLAISNGCIESIDDFNWIHKNNQTFKATLADLITAKYTFVILRSPFTRLASVYLDKIVDKTVEMWQLNDTLKREVDVTNLTFKEFASLVCKKGMIKSNIHWRPQVDFLMYKQYDDYLALEQSEQTFKTIEQNTGMQIVDARSLTKHGTGLYKKVEDSSFAEVPASEIFQMKKEGLIPSYSSLYDEEIFRLVSKIYAEDITLYESKFGKIDFGY